MLPETLSLIERQIVIAACALENVKKILMEEFPESNTFEPTCNRKEYDIDKPELKRIHDFTWACNRMSYWITTAKIIR